LSFSDELKREKILKQSGATDYEIEQANALLNQTKNQGYFIGPSPQISGITNISVPIFTGSEMLAVLTVPYVTLDSDAVHHAVDSIETTKNELVAICQSISHQLTPQV
jgi:DNA-binding IclR family transcriptional regulator